MSSSAARNYRTCRGPCRAELDQGLLEKAVSLSRSGRNNATFGSYLGRKQNFKALPRRTKALSFSPPKMPTGVPLQSRKDSPWGTWNTSHWKAARIPQPRELLQKCPGPPFPPLPTEHPPPGLTQNHSYRKACCPADTDGNADARFLGWEFSDRRQATATQTPETAISQLCKKVHGRCSCCDTRARDAGRTPPMTAAPPAPLPTELPAPWILTHRAL